MNKHKAILILTGLFLTQLLVTPLHSREKHWLSVYTERHHQGSMITGITYSSHADPKRNLVQPYGKIGLKFASLKRDPSLIVQSHDKKESDEFVALDGAVGVMVGKSLFAYGELGVDVGEMIMYSHSQNENLYHIDFFGAAGIGIQFPVFKINVYAKYNRINGLFIEDHNKGYIGTEVAISF